VFNYLFTLQPLRATDSWTDVALNTSTCTGTLPVTQKMEHLPLCKTQKPSVQLTARSPVRTSVGKSRKIFLESNRLGRGDGFWGAPHSGTLESLTLANCHLKNFPLWGMYSNLLELSMSANNPKRILPQQLVPMSSSLSVPQRKP
jgi:hypothetical protein